MGKEFVMIQQATRKAVYGMREGMGGLWEGSLGRMGVRNPVQRSSWLAGIGRRPGLTAILSVLSAFAAAGLVFYLRKRRQVAEHYNMGENEGAWEGGTVPGHETAEPARI